MPRKRQAAAELDDEDEDEPEAEPEDEAFDEEAAQRAAGRMKVAELRAALEELGETPQSGKAAMVEQLVAAQRAAAEEKGEEEAEEEAEEEEDGLYEWEDHDLNVAALREVRELRGLVISGGACKHELGGLDAAKRSTCGVCPAVGRKIHPPRAGKFGCKVCQVRICSWRCLNEHINDGVGKRSGKELVFKDEPEGGTRVPGRSHGPAPGPRRRVRVGGSR